jgi:hypothetical protein
VCNLCAVVVVGLSTECNILPFLNFVGEGRDLWSDYAFCKSVGTAGG